jgi:hypothetical protein
VDEFDRRVYRAGRDKGAIASGSGTVGERELLGI